MSYTKQDVAKAAALIAGGAIIGAGLGLLFAPQSGVETRRSIKRYAKKAQVEVARFGREVKEKMDKAVEQGKTLIGKHEDTAKAA
jgi:gas vesicle protein